MTKHFATITILGRDKAGLIARITQTLFQLGANIEAMEEQVTRRQFSMTLQASWMASRLDDATIRQEIHSVAAELGMEAKICFAPNGGLHRLAIFVTRESHVLKALLKISPKRLRVQPVVVIGSRPDLEKMATDHGLPFYHIPFLQREEAEQRCLKILEKHQIDLVVLARFMKILSPNFVWRWKNRIINIHPSLLPAFPGANGYRQAYEKGVEVVGVTAHFVTPNLDEGPIIAQESFRIRPREPLSKIVERGQILESRCVLRAIRKFVTQKLDVHWGRVYQS